MRKIVWVEMTGGQVSKIFKNQKQAFLGCPDPQAKFKDEAVGSVRRQVYDRQKGRCLNCGDARPYEGDLFTRMHMHEEIPKGKGGLVSLENCVCLCARCHLSGQHGDRRPRFGEQ